MEYVAIKGIDIKASRIVFGCAGDVMSSGGDNSKMLDAAVFNGINFFDTARCYGDSEISLGNWIKQRKNREEIIVLSKGCHPKPESLDVHRVSRNDILEDIDISLKCLSTEYIDIYLLHRDDKRVAVAELIDTLEEVRKAGKIKCYGVSNWTLERFKEAQDYAEKSGAVGFSVNSPYYSLANQVNDPWESGSETISISGDENAEARQYFTEKRIPVVAYSSLARGLFSGKFKASEKDKASDGMDKFALKGYFSDENINILARVEKLAAERDVSVPQIALAYLLNQKLQVHPVVSFSKEGHLTDNVKAVDIKLSEDEIRYLERPFNSKI